MISGVPLLALGTAATTTSQPAAVPTLVQVDGGMVRGTAVNDLIVFKGIPFAQPPVGALRWQTWVNAWEQIPRVGRRRRHSSGVRAASTRYQKQSRSRSTKLSYVQT